MLAMTSSTALRSPSRSTALIRQLEQEWTVLRSSRAALATARSWQLPIVRFESLDELAAAIAAVVPDGDSGHDVDPTSEAAMIALLRVARHDDLAARVVLQRMLPGLVSTAARAGRAGADVARTVDDLVTEAWPVIRNFDERRLGGFMIAKLVRSCEYFVLERPRRRSWTCEPVAAPVLEQIPAPVDEPSAMCELIELVHDGHRRGVIDPDDLALLAALLGSSTARDAAASLKVTTRTVRNRRKAVADRLRELAAA